MKRLLVVGLVSVLCLMLPLGSQSAGATFYGGPGGLVFEQFVPKDDDRWDRQWDVYTRTLDGHRARNLTQSTLINELSVAWSPDGRSIAYVRSPVAQAGDERSPLAPPRSSLVVSTANGNRSRVVLRSDEETGVILTVGWSPDGTHLVYTRNWYDRSQTPRTGGYYVKGHLETIRLRDGHIRKLVVKQRAALVWPQWSPDGSYILFEAYHDAYGGPKLSLLMAGRDGIINLASRGIRGWFPSWTPDGDILHTAWRPWQPDCLSYCTDVWVSDPFGEEPARMITTGPHDLEGDGWDDFLYRARLSPDGKSLAVIFGRNTENPYEAARPQHQYQLWVLELASQAWRKFADAGPPANAFGDAPGDNLRSLDWQPRCTVRGTSGSDVLVGSQGRDLICGLGGNDVIQGRGGDDVVFGHGGDDVITGGTGRDIVVGNAGRDRCDRDPRDFSRVC